MMLPAHQANMILVCLRIGETIIFQVPMDTSLHTWTTMVKHHISQKTTGEKLVQAMTFSVMVS